MFTKINLGLWLAIAVFAIGIAYLINVNSFVTQGYERTKLEQRLNELKETNKRLELESAQMKSIQNIESGVTKLNLIPSGAVNYQKKTDFSFNR